MALKIIGKVHSIGATQQINSKNGAQPFYKREIILDATRFDGLTGERGYDNFPMFEFSGDKCSELDAFKLGDIVEVSFELQGSFYKDKDNVERNFTRVRAYKIEPYAMKKQAPKPQALQEQVPPPPVEYPPMQDYSSQPQGDLPF